MQTLRVFAALILLTGGMVMGAASAESDKAPGLADGKLKPCPNSPNCICTEFAADSKHFGEPLEVTVDEQTPERILAVVRQMGGELKRREGNYLAFTFTSRIFRFVDDFEIRLDSERNLLHIRSASRVGYSDFGVNRRRVERFREVFTAAQSS